MTNQSLVLTLVTAILLTGSATHAALAQTPTPSSRGVLIQDLQERAQRDAKVGRAPVNVQELSLLYGEQARAAGVSLQEAAMTYEEAYATAKKSEPWWRSVSPNVGWLLAIVLLLLLVFRDFLKEILTSALNSIKEYTYNLVAGHRVFRRAALQRYRQALSAKYERLKVPFRPDQPLNLRQVYVPLKAKGRSDIQEVDALQAIAEHKFLMIVGAPGSGKSMLLRHLSLAYAEGRLPDLAKQPIPILLELNRLNEQDQTIEDQLIEVLRLNDFPKANNFVRRGLKTGTLMLLFDGLDEVNTSKREQVVKKIKDLVDTYEECRAMVTCRTAVYRNEFAETASQTLEIIEFSDQQIRSFLEAWQQYMPAGKSIEQLILTLRERPRILALARNPLLLTIIAYLYTDTEFVLPNSRAEFYDQSVDVLLRQWKGEGTYKAPHKRLVLQHLALFNQDRGVEGDEDRRSIDLTTVIEEIKRVLPDLNLELREANPMLEEIVERSGLLLSIDGGTRFQFAHLTLQEFFAATALRDNAAALLARFHKDRDAWRETVKLWCGLDLDSTQVIREISLADSITAFECLADGQKVSPDLAESIIESFKPRLGSADDSGDAVIQAFAGVASGPSPRSRAVFKFLAGALAGNIDSQKTAAARALSLTNQPTAVHALADHYGTTPELHTALVRMGDLAVKSLTALALAGHGEALDDLRTIGTPQAATALTSFLWSEDEPVVVRAAYHVAALLPQKNIEETLRHYELPNEAWTADSVRWVWEPFNEPAGSALPSITGRIAFLIAKNAKLSERNTSGKIDPRIAIPLIVAAQEAQPLDANSEAVMELGKALFSRLDRFTVRQLGYEASLDDHISGQVANPNYRATEIAKQLSELLRFLSQSPENRALVSMLDSLDQTMQLRLLNRLLNWRRVTTYDWQTISRQLDDQLKGWQANAILGTLASLSLISLIEIVTLFVRSQSWFNWMNGLLVVSAILIGGMWYVIWDEDMDYEIALLGLSGPIAVIYMMFKREFSLGEAGVAMLVTVLTLGANVYFTSLAVLRYFPAYLWLSILCWLIIIAAASTRFILDHYRSSAGRNPLRGILDAEDDPFYGPVPIV